MTDKLMVNDVLKRSKKAVARDLRLKFKCDQFEIEVDGKFNRLDAKKILPFEEFEQTTIGTRVLKKLVGYNRGTATYYPAIKDEKGKWIADINAVPVDPDEVEKVILDKRSGLIAKKDTRKGLWFVKIAPSTIMTEWHIEDTYVIYSDNNSDSMLKIYDFLTETNQIGVFKFNPYGTTYNAFLIPQRVEGGKFRLLLSTTRVKMNKPEIAPTMVIANAKIQARERERIDEIGVMSAIEEI